MADNYVTYKKIFSLYIPCISSIDWFRSAEHTGCFFWLLTNSVWPHALILKNKSVRSNWIGQESKKHPVEHQQRFRNPLRICISPSSNTCIMIWFHVYRNASTSWPEFYPETKFLCNLRRNAYRDLLYFSIFLFVYSFLQLVIRIALLRN